MHQITFKHLVTMFILFLILATAAAQIPFFGRCPEMPVKKGFDASRYTGTWYEIEKYFAIFQLGGTCTTAEYTDNGDGKIGVFNTQIQELSRRKKTIKGVARKLSTDGTAKLGVTFPSVPLMGEANYWVLDTDYQSYSIVWSCTNMGLMNFQIVWFLARDRNPPEDVRLRVHVTLQSLNLKTSLLKKTRQTNCTT